MFMTVTQRAVAVCAAIVIAATLFHSPGVQARMVVMRDRAISLGLLCAKVTFDRPRNKRRVSVFVNLWITFCCP